MHSIKNNIRKIIIFTSLLSNVSYAMLTNRTQSENEKIFSPDAIAWNLVIEHYLLDHQAICSFAAASKYTNALMIATAKQRSEKLGHRCPSDHYLSKLLHKYGSARCYAFKWPEIQELTLGYHELNHELNNDNVITKHQRLQGFMSPLWDKQRPFFNEQGDMCFHGHGQGEFNHKFDQAKTLRITNGIFRYSIDGSIAACTVARTANKDQMGLLSFLPYPSLFQALLGSQEKNIILYPESYSIPGVEYSFDKITIPDDYQNKVDFTLITGDMPADEVFPEIPDFVKNVIEQRRKEQTKR